MGISATIDLWPAQLNVVKEAVTPLAILRQQAALLPGKTDGYVEGEVGTSAERDELYHTFYLRAPALDNFRLRLFTVIYRAEKVYPMRIVPDIDPSSDDDSDWPPIVCPDQNTFVSELGKFLSNDRVVYIIHSLILQSRDATA